MGQQQILLIIVGVIIVGIAIGVAVSQFFAQSGLANKDGLTASVEAIAGHAYHYKLRPKIFGGGGGQYTDYEIPSQRRSDEHGNYKVLSADEAQCVLTGTSKLESSWIVTCTVEERGEISMTYTGW